MKKEILFPLVLIILAITACENSKKEPHPCDKGCSYEISNGKDTLNRIYAGLKQGHWIVRKMVIPKKIITPEDTKETLQNKIIMVNIEEGLYKDDKKEGVWKYYDEQDGSFKDSVVYKNGETVN